MPPVIFLAIIGAAGLAGYKLMSALVRHAAHQPKRTGTQSTRTAPARDLGNLEWDEDQGVYRPGQKGQV